MAATSLDHAFVPLVRVTRGDLTECVFHGAVAVSDAEGRLMTAAGDPRAVMFLRSAAKPFQLLPVIESGAADRYRLTPAELAVACASHGAQEFHVEAVARILEKAGLSEAHLMCGAHEPLHPPTARRLREEGRSPTPIQSNCSGKHAAMLCLALHRGHPAQGYYRTDHPVQTEVLQVVAELTGVPAVEIPLASDGCTVPTFGVPLSAGAAAFARLMEPGRFPSARRLACLRVVEAMRAHPEMVGGDGVLDTDLIRSAGVELIAKRGAEGIYGIGFRRQGRGYGVLFKMADGDGGRGRNATALAIARQLGLVPEDRLESLIPMHVPAVLNRRGFEVGRVEACFTL